MRDNITNMMHEGCTESNGSLIFYGLFNVNVWSKCDNVNFEFRQNPCCFSIIYLAS